MLKPKQLLFIFCPEIKHFHTNKNFYKSTILILVNMSVSVRKENALCKFQKNICEPYLDVQEYPEHKERSKLWEVKKGKQIGR